MPHGVTVSIRRLSLGSGYRYLMESVAAGDGAASQSSSLTRYYAELGTPPGRFLGAGLAGLDGGRGVAAGTVVGEEHLFNLLGLCADPVTGEPLGRAPNTQPKSLRQRIAGRVAELPGSLTESERAARVARIEASERERERRLTRPVAGFDLTFSVPKSISSAWALADEGTKAVIYEAHCEAIRRAIAYAETEVFHSRSGTNGVVQEDIVGAVAAAFDHWDSRAGDPQLHTHVVVANRAQSTSDGRWRTIDSRGLFKSVVALSELHQGVLQDLLAEALGWGFDPRARKHSAVPRFEVTGVPDALMTEFSQRSAAIEVAKEALVQTFRQTHGRSPSLVEVIRLRQRATIETRPAKEHRALAEMTIAWRERGAAFVGADASAWVGTLRDRNDLPALRSSDLGDPILADLARAASEVVAERRATFTQANLLAEVHRQLHGVRFASPDERIAVAQRAAELAEAAAIELSVPELHHVPVRFRRADGSSRFRGKGFELYTTPALLEAEARLLDAGRQTSGPRVAPGVVAEACEANLVGRDYRLSAEQTLAVEAIVTSGRVLDVLVGPAGTGKTTTMAGLRQAWEAVHGAGSLVGLAPSAAASEVLGAELGIEAENTAKWLSEARRKAERLANIARLQGVLRGRRSSSATTERAHRRLAELRTEVERWQLRAGQLMVVDEASLAGTFALDELVHHAQDAGAKVLLVGDWAQLSAVEAGGAFDMLVADRADLVPELSDVRRFKEGWEKRASVELRIGDESAVDAYEAHGRLVEGEREDLLDSLYQAWSTDVARGCSSLMIAGDLGTVSALNERARTERVAVGEVQGDGLAIADGAVAGVGDRVVTRQNDRWLSIGRSWVKNGDQWVVAATHNDGSMTIRRAQGSGQVVLPASYVREHVELGYASTAHRAQGATVDTAHAMISPTTTRQVLYVSATRGRWSNRLYVDTAYDPDPDTSHGPAQLTSAKAVLAGVLGNIGAERSATATIRVAQEDAESMAILHAEYQSIAKIAQAERWDSLLAACGLGAEQLAEVRGSGSYAVLQIALRDAEARGLDVDATLPALVAGRRIRDTEDSAKVLHARVDAWLAVAPPERQPSAGRLIAGIIPAALGITDPDMGRALDERAAAMESRARTVAEQAVEADRAWVRSLGPVPTDPARRAAWLAQVSTVAAYRDHWKVKGAEPVGASEGISIERVWQAKRAVRAAERAQYLAGRTASDVATAASETVSIETGVEL